jgi:hypothetical protein
MLKVYQVLTEALCKLQPQPLQLHIQTNSNVMTVSPKMNGPQTFNFLTTHKNILTQSPVAGETQFSGEI